VRRELDRLRDILEAIERIEEYAARGKAAFDDDPLLQTWVVHHITIIGEAARAIPEEFRAGYSGMPWKEIIGMRHILVHHYFDIDAEAVWAVVESDLERLKTEVSAILNSQDDGRD
jgi:uncharacterized protein with HEPN domain